MINIQRTIVAFVSKFIGQLGHSWYIFELFFT